MVMEQLATMSNAQSRHQKGLKSFIFVDGAVLQLRWNSWKRRCRISKFSFFRFHVNFEGVSLILVLQSYRIGKWLALFATNWGRSKPATPCRGRKGELLNLKGYPNVIRSLLGGGFKHFHPYLGRWSNLTNIFQGGSNHQLVCVWSLALWDLAFHGLLMHNCERMRRDFWRILWALWCVLFWHQTHCICVRCNWKKQHCFVQAHI